MNINLVFLTDDLRWMTEYLGILDRAFEARKTEFEERLNAQAADMSEEERDEFMEFYSDDYHAYASNLPRLSRLSFII